MKARIILLAFTLALGFLFAACSASQKTCPAYSNNTAEQVDSNRS